MHDLVEWAYLSVPERSKFGELLTFRLCFAEALFDFSE